MCGRYGQPGCLKFPTQKYPAGSRDEEAKSKENLNGSVDCNIHLQDNHEIKSIHLYTTSSREQNLTN